MRSIERLRWREEINSEPEPKHCQKDQEGNSVKYGR